MKATLYFTLTLLTFTTLAFVPNSIAQDNSPEYVVRVIYFIPNDREPDPNIDERLDTLIKKAQQYYADQMESHGFGRKTFRFEFDNQGNAVVHHVIGEFNEAYYQNPSTGSWIVWNEIEELFGEAKNILLLALDSSSKFLDGDQGGFGAILGRGEGDSLSGRILFSTPLIELGEGVVVHELGHAFGLVHDLRIDGTRIFTNQRLGDWMTTSFCAAEWLDVNRYFNTTQKDFNQDTNVQMLTSNSGASPNSIRLQFEITDPDGLHQAQLYNPLSSVVYPSIIACKKLNGKTEIVEFVTTDLTPENEDIALRVIDGHGNFSQYYFPIDITNLISPAEVVEIPDANLEAAVKAALNLPSSAVLTSHTMLDLTFLHAPTNKISDLTGLQYATNLSYLLLGYLDRADNQIKDITPLAGLKKLVHLTLDRGEISDITPLVGLATNLRSLQLGRNNISDIKPLKGLTKLESLNLDNNQISDITPLAGLTNLEYLELQHNQISDVSPLARLTKLEDLRLWKNPILNRESLRVLSVANPDIRIYFEFSRDLLPVTLSHFRAEHTDAGVILKWTTESEVENAGFYIYRSQTRDGTFKVVNPTLIQGAGTTSERNEYTWTDTTAKPNVAYYYRIEDISHAGERKQLATVRMRGFVSASGKLTTRWADLKVQN